MNRRWSSLVLGVAAAVLVLDQLTKAWALAALDDGPIELFWTLRLALTFNSGVAFSMAEGLGSVVGVVAVAIAAGVLWWSRTAKRSSVLVASGAIIGGAIGNVIDRAFRSSHVGQDGFLGGSVVDFVDVGWWPVFNVADAAIVVGGVALVFLTALEPQSDPPESDPVVSGPNAAGSVESVS